MMKNINKLAIDLKNTIDFAAIFVLTCQVLPIYLLNTSLFFGVASYCILSLSYMALFRYVFFSSYTRKPVSTTFQKILNFSFSNTNYFSPRSYWIFITTIDYMINMVMFVKLSSLGPFALFALTLVGLIAPYILNKLDRVIAQTAFYSFKFAILTTIRTTLASAIAFSINIAVSFFCTISAIAISLALVNLFLLGPEVAGIVSGLMIFSAAMFFSKITSAFSNLYSLYDSFIVKSVKYLSSLPSENDLLKIIIYPHLMGLDNPANSIYQLTVQIDEPFKNQLIRVLSPSVLQYIDAQTPIITLKQFENQINRFDQHLCVESSLTNTNFIPDNKQTNRFFNLICDSNSKAFIPFVNSNKLTLFLYQRAAFEQIIYTFAAFSLKQTSIIVDKYNYIVSKKIVEHLTISYFKDYQNMQSDRPIGYKTYLHATIPFTNDEVQQLTNLTFETPTNDKINALNALQQEQLAALTNEDFSRIVSQVYTFNTQA